MGVSTFLDFGGMHWSKLPNGDWGKLGNAFHLDVYPSQRSELSSRRHKMPDIACTSHVHLPMLRPD
eukprot:5550952-Amphidinium_carterae.3